MGTKNNPGDFDCYENAEPDEPMFVLLARDDDAPFLVEQWAERRRQTFIRHHGPDPAKAEREERKIEEAYACAEAMRRWRRWSQSR